MDADDLETLRREAIGRMTPAERFQRCYELYAFIHRALSLQIAEDHPTWSADEVRWEVAKRMYLTDRGAQRLLALAKDPAQRERP